MPRRHHKSNKRQARRRQVPPVKRCADCGAMLTGAVCAECQELQAVRFWKRHYPTRSTAR